VLESSNKSKNRWLESIYFVTMAEQTIVGLTRAEHLITIITKK